MLQNNMEVLVLDEADLLLSYGYQADLEGISPQLSQRCHRMLFGATTSDEVDRIARRILHKPAVCSTLFANMTAADVTLHTVHVIWPLGMILNCNR